MSIIMHIASKDKANKLAVILCILPWAMVSCFVYFYGTVGPVCGYT